MNYKDPVTHKTAPEVMDALGEFYKLPEEVRQEIILRSRQEEKERRKQHLRKLGVKLE